MSVPDDIFRTNPDAVLLAMIELAVADLRLLRARGMVQGDKPAPPGEWPKSARGLPRAAAEYRTRSQVSELCHFFRGGHFRRLLAHTRAAINPDAALSRLGFTEG